MQAQVGLPKLIAYFRQHYKLITLDVSLTNDRILLACCWCLTKRRRCCISHSSPELAKSLQMLPANEKQTRAGGWKNLLNSTYQAVLWSQRQFALTVRNIFFINKIIGPPEIFQNLPWAWFCLFLSKFWNHRHLMYRKYKVTVYTVVFKAPILLLQSTEYTECQAYYPVVRNGSPTSFRPMGLKGEGGWGTKYRRWDRHSGSLGII